MQNAAGLVGYVHRRLGLPIASTAPLGKISERFTRAVHRFAVTEGIEWVDFAKGHRKDDIMQERLKGFTPVDNAFAAVDDPQCRFLRLHWCSLLLWLV